MKRLLMSSLLVAACACGGTSGSGAQAQEPKGSGDPAPTGDAPSDEQLRLKQHQFDACDAIGPHITQCALAPLRAKDDAALTDEERDALTDTNSHGAYTDMFVDKCKDSELSVRQVKVLHDCAAAPPPATPTEADCEPFLACLDAMKSADG